MNDEISNYASLQTIFEATQGPQHPIQGPIAGKVTWKSELFEFNQLKKFYFKLRDNTHEVHVNAYGEVASELFSRVNLSAAYKISNFTCIKHHANIEVVLTSLSLVEPTTLQLPCAPIHRTFLSNIVQNGKKGEYFNILVFVKDVVWPIHDHAQKSGDLAKRIDLCISDQSGCDMTLILWRKHAEQFTEQTKGNPMNSVLFIKQAYYFNNKGYLSSQDRPTIMEVNPSFKEATDLACIAKAARAFRDSPVKVGDKRKRNDQYEISTLAPKKRIRLNEEVLQAKEEKEAVSEDNDDGVSSHSEEETQPVAVQKKNGDDLFVIPHLFIFAVIASMFAGNFI